MLASCSHHPLPTLIQLSGFLPPASHSHRTLPIKIPIKGQGTFRCLLLSVMGYSFVLVLLCGPDWSYIPQTSLELPTLMPCGSSSVTKSAPSSPAATLLDLVLFVSTITCTVVYPPPGTSWIRKRAANVHECHEDHWEIAWSLVT